METQAKRQFEQVLSRLLKGEKEKELTEKLGILKLFLESADFSQLRSESEKHLLAGEKVKFILHLKEGKPEYEMRIT